MGYWKRAWVAALISAWSACSCAPAQVPDGGNVDPGAVDAGDVSADMDAGTSDAGTSDAGELDGGQADGGTPGDDAGTLDAGPLARWRAVVPSGRSNATLTWDPDAQRLLLFGGTVAGSTLADLWAWDGTGWSELEVSAWPLDREAHSAAWDSARHRLVVFGGFSRAVLRPLDDTWEFDGTRWQQRSPTRAPPAGGGHALAFDPVRLHTLLVAPSGGTWTWDGTDWTPLAVTGPMDVAPVLAWDASRQRMVCFGTGSGTTWDWNGSSWTQASPATSPPTLARAALAFDAARQRVVLVGSRTSLPTGGSPTETWEWDGATWADVTPQDGAPRVGDRFQLAWDATRARLVLHGGVDEWGELWERTGTQWALRQPRPKGRPLMPAYDSARAEFVHFGGMTTTSSGAPYPVSQETWVRSGRSWTQRTPAVSPPARAFSTLGWDPTAQRVLLTGGLDLDGGLLTDTWAWDGTTWAPLTPSASLPPAGPLTPVVVGSSPGRLHVVGGPNLQAEVWAWTGSTWSQVPGRLPIESRGVSATWDALRGRAVFLGGGRLVEWDGVGSLPSDAGVVAAPAGASSIAYDPLRQRTIAVLSGARFDGGLGLQEPSSFFEWDGTRWVEVPLAAQPPGGRGGALGWDPLEQRLVLSSSTDWWLER